jgi:excisionase family DNA binding protein
MKREWYTVEEAMRQLHISRRTIYKRIEDQSLPSRKLGGRRLIPAYAVEQEAPHATPEEAEATR